MLNGVGGTRFGFPFILSANLYDPLEGSGDETSICLAGDVID